MTLVAPYDGRTLRHETYSPTRDLPPSIALKHAIAGENLPQQLRVREVMRTLRDHPVPGRTYAETAHHAYQLLSKLVAGLGGSASSIARDFRLMSAIYDGAAIDAPRLLTTLHGLTLGLAPILSLGTGTAYQRECLADLEDGTIAGAFVGTELGYGTNLLGLRTQAVWHPDQRSFTLHTPGPEAIKFMPNLADPDVGKIGVVLARLIAHGQDEGVWPFLIRIRASNGQLAAGIEVVALPPSSQGPEMDHGGIRFNGSSLPEDALLCGQVARFDAEGRFVCELDKHARFHAGIGSLQNGRALYTGAAVASARAGWSITIRYAMQRLTSGDVLLGDRDGVQRELVSCAARLFAVTALSNVTRARFTSGNDPTAGLLAMLTKPLATYTAHHVLETCRRLCGAQGLFGANYISDYILRVNGMITAEGANGSLEVAAGRLPALVAAGRAPGHMDISRLRILEDSAALPWWHAMLHEREQTIVTAARAGTLTGVKATGPDSSAVEVTAAVAERLAADSLAACAADLDDPQAASILSDLVAVWALERIDAHAGWFAAHGQLPPERAQEVERQLTARYSALAPHLQTTLLDAFDIPRLPAPIDSGDYVESWITRLGWDPNEFPDSADTEQL